MAQPLRERGRQAHLRDGVRESLDLALYALLPRPVGVDLVGCSRELVRTAQRFLLDPHQHIRRGQGAAHVFDHDAIDVRVARGDTPTYRGAAILVRRAPVCAGVHLHHRAATLAAPQDAAEQRCRHTTAAFAAPGAPGRGHALAHRLPWLVIEDAQLWARDRLPFGFRPDKSLPPSRIRVLDPLRAVPYVPADVELVVQHACALGRRAVERRYAPGPAPRAADAPRVKLRGDALAGLARGITREDLAHDRGLRFVDFQTMPDRVAAAVEAGNNGTVAVRQAARVIAALDLASESPMRLGTQVVQIGFADEPAHPAQELSASPGRAVVAVGDADDADSPVLEPPNNRLLLDQIARQAVERFDQEHVEAAGEGVGHAGACARTAADGRRSANGAVGMHCDDGQSESSGAFAAETSLILDRRDGLQVGAEASIDGGAHGR